MVKHSPKLLAHEEEATLNFLQPDFVVVHYHMHAESLDCSLQGQSEGSYPHTLSATELGIILNPQNPECYARCLEAFFHIKVKLRVQILCVYLSHIF